MEITRNENTAEGTTQLTLHWWRKHEVAAGEYLLRDHRRSLMQRLIDKRRGNPVSVETQTYEAFAAVADRNRRQPLDLTKEFRGDVTALPSERVVSLAGDPAAVMVRALRRCRLDFLGKSAGETGDMPTGTRAFVLGELRLLAAEQSMARARARAAAFGAVWPEGTSDDTKNVHVNQIAADSLRIGEISLVQLLDEPLE